MKESVMATINDRPWLAARNLIWVHVLVFGSIALACYIAPETPFGESAWLPLARLAVYLFAASLAALIVFLVGGALSGSRRQAALALLAALVLDVQIPILAFSQPASLEYLHARVGIPWFVVPVVFLTLVGMTVHCLLRLKRVVAAGYAGASS
jgi:hypothetical protein